MGRNCAGRLYDYPRYYEFAFGFRDIAADVDTLEECARRYGRIPVESVLEIGCGPAPYMAELVSRGYRYVGIDVNERALEYARRLAERRGISALLQRRDMTRFRLERPVELAFLPIGSLYAATMEEVRSHFESVAASVRPGGLYLLDWCVQLDGFSEAEQSWEKSQGDLRVKGRYERQFFDQRERIYVERLVFEVTDGEDAYELREEVKRQALEPNDLFDMLQDLGCFEFMGCWNNWDLSAPIEDMANGPSDAVRPIVLLLRV